MSRIVERKEPSLLLMCFIASEECMGGSAGRIRCYGAFADTWLVLNFHDINDSYSKAKLVLEKRFITITENHKMKKTHKAHINSPCTCSTYFCMMPTKPKSTAFSIVNSPALPLNQSGRIVIIQISINTTTNNALRTWGAQVLNDGCLVRIRGYMITGGVDRHAGRGAIFK